jgi:hypothetical protein
MRPFEFSPGRAIGNQALAQLRKALVFLPLFHQRPAAQDHRMRAEKGNYLLRRDGQVRVCPLPGLLDIPAELIKSGRPA